MTSALIAGAVVVILVVVFGFDRSRLAKKVGEVEAERDDHKRRADLYEDALAIMVAPEPTLDELERMSNTAALAAGAAADDLREVEQSAVHRLVRTGATSKARKTDG